MPYMNVMPIVTAPTCQLAAGNLRQCSRAEGSTTILQVAAAGSAPAATEGHLQTPKLGSAAVGAAPATSKSHCMHAAQAAYGCHFTSRLRMTRRACLPRKCGSVISVLAEHIRFVHPHVALPLQKSDASAPARKVSAVLRHTIQCI